MKEGTSSKIKLLPSLSHSTANYPPPLFKELPPTPIPIALYNLSPAIAKLVGAVPRRAAALPICITALRSKKINK